MRMDSSSGTNVCIAYRDRIRWSFDRSYTVQVAQHLSCLLPQLCFELCSSKDIMHPYIHIHRIHWGLECYLDLSVGGIHTHVGGWHTTPMWICIRCSFFSNFYYSGVDPLPRERGATLLYVGG